MGDRTSIEWTEATWNPATGCTKVSPGCDHCYAETIAHRFAGTPAYPDGFAPTLRPERLDQPLRWTRPRRIFVCSMADLFHDAVPDEYLEQVFDVMEQAHWHTFQVLTKRHARMRAFLRKRQASREDYAAQFSYCPTEAMRTSPAAQDAQRRADNPPANIWVGVSAENQQWADIRIPALLETPAAVRWISAEPLLGSIDLHPNWLHGKPGWGPEYPEPTSPTGLTVQDIVTGPRLDWVVAGGESGRGARPMHPDWARSLRDQCEAAGVAFLLKQWGEWGPAPWSVRVCDPEQGWQGTDDELAAAKSAAEATGATHATDRRGYVVELSHKPWSIERSPEAPVSWSGIRRYGKKAAGRELDGRTHDGYPA